MSQKNVSQKQIIIWKDRERERKKEGRVTNRICELGYYGDMCDKC